MQSSKTFNFTRGELSQDDKEAMLLVAQKLPSWGRIFLFGETRLGSPEENEALLAHNDGLFEPLFMETARKTMKMRRYNSIVARLTVPHAAMSRAWESEREFLGLPGLDDSEDFITAAMWHIVSGEQRTTVFPCRKFGVLRPGQQEEDDFNIKYMGAMTLFKKTGYRAVTVPEFFSRLPKGWFLDIGYRKLTDEELLEVERVSRRGRGGLMNGELAALDKLAANNYSIRSVR
jgi:hypothetical protein